MTLSKQPSPAWTKEETRFFASLKSPFAIQCFLDETEYSADPIYRCPRRAIADRRAHCVDGALLAAAALRLLGYPPLIMELQAVRDDDHLLAVYRKHDCWGAVAKSNFSTLRFREPVYRSLRELAMSYFEGYFNVAGEKTLRAYSAALNLEKFDRLNWQTEDAGIDTVIARLEAARHYPLVTPAMIAGLEKADARSVQAGLLGAKADGLYQL